MYGKDSYAEAEAARIIGEIQSMIDSADEETVEALELAGEKLVMNWARYERSLYSGVSLPTPRPPRPDNPFNNQSNLAGSLLGALGLGGFGKP